MVQLAETVLDEPLQLPWICGRQRHRDSRVTVTESTEDYYHRTVYIPFLDNIIEQFNERFGTNPYSRYYLTHEMGNK